MKSWLMLCTESDRLEAEIKVNLAGLGYEV